MNTGNGGPHEPEEASSEELGRTGSGPGEATSSRASSAWIVARGPAALGVLLFIAWFFSLARFAPSPVPADAPDTVFSSGRAMIHLAEIARTAHPTGSPEHTRVREYLLQRFRDLGHDPEVQTATSGVFTMATVRNIVFRIPGSEPGGPAVLVTAHYDSTSNSTGAADDGSGVVAILETVRALGTGPPLRNDIIVLITDAEELGLLGAHAFADEHPWMEDVAIVLGIEMRGGGGPSIMFETGANNGWVIKAFQSAAPYPWANSISYEIYKRMPNDTDFTVFKRAGKQGLNFAGVDKPSVYHQSYDTVENLSEATLQHHGSHILAMLRHFGSVDLTSVEAPNVSYVTLPVVGLVVYGKVWIWILGGFVLVAWVLAFSMLYRNGSAVKPVVAGVVTSAVYLAILWWIAQLLVAWRLGAHPEVGALAASVFHAEGWYVLGIAAFALVAATILFRLVQRWFSAAGLVIGALVIPVGLAVAVTVVAPFAAVNLQWPGLAACGAAMALVGASQQEPLTFWRWLLIVVAAVPVVLVLSPLVEGTWLAMSLAMAPMIAVLIGVTILLLLPAIETIGEIRWWWVPLAGAVASAAFLAVSVWMAEPTAERPAPSTLRYVLDRENESAYWATDATRDDTHPGIAWATNRVGPFGEARVLEGFDRWNLLYRLAPAPTVEVQPLSVTLTSTSTDSNRPVSLSVVSGVGAEKLMILLGEEGPHLTSINGTKVPSDMRHLEHWGIRPNGLTLDFARPPAGENLRFVVVEHLHRPEELVGRDVFARPPELAPNIGFLSDMALIRTQVTVDPVAGTIDTAGKGASERADQSDPLNSPPDG